MRDSIRNSLPVELTAPVGCFASLQAAIEAGADSIYFGLQGLNMRENSSNNFSLEELPKISRLCKKHKVKTYLAINTLLYDEELSLVETICKEAKRCKLSAIIATDLAAISIARKYELPVHLSTQANVSNIEAVRFFASFVDAIVLARELSLSQIEAIIKAIHQENIRGPSGKVVRIEVFAHGALCVAIAGKCQMSLALHNASANRGKCLQPCRRKYRILEEASKEELLIDNHYVLSPKDLSTIAFLDEIVKAGVSLLKIEGRGRSPEYVKVTTECYREALQSIFSGNYSSEKVKNWKKRLSEVYNRGFWEGGYYLGKKLGEWSSAAGSLATKKKVFLGKATHYFPKCKAAEFLLENGPLKEGDSLLIIGPTTGVIETKAHSLRKGENLATTLVEKGELFTLAVNKKIRKNDQLYLWNSQEISEKELSKNKNMTDVS